MTLIPMTISSVTSYCIAAPQLRANRLLLKRLSAIGVYWTHDRDGAMFERVTGRVLKMLAEGRIDPHVEHDYGLTDLPRALEALRDRRSKGKLVLELR